MSDDDLSESVEKGSNNIIEGISKLGEGGHHLFRSLNIWFEGHPILKWVLIAPASAVIGNYGIQILTWVYAYFFGATVPISRDVMVKVFPAPIGFTLWILLTGFILLAIVTYLRFVTLRQQIEELEKQVQG